MSESRHLDCQVPPQARVRNAIGVHERLYPRPLRRYGDEYYPAAPEPYRPGCKQPYLEDDEWEAAFVLPLTPPAGLRGPQVGGIGSRRFSLP